jgi:high-affinity iron transporter
MQTFLQGAILGLREGLEASLIIVIILQYIKSTGTLKLRSSVWYGVTLGIAASLLIGTVLFFISSAIDKTGEAAKLWESGASILALILITTFIIWMIRHGSDMAASVREKTALNFSKTGIILLSAAMVAREGAEVAIFTFAGEYNIISLFTGIAAAIGIAVLVYYSLLKVNLRVIFNITLIYLILQAGFLIGYGIHEGLSAMKDLGVIDGSAIIYSKAFDLSSTVFDHKEGILGVPLFVVFGWYSKPEWIQFIAQYLYTFGIFIYWLIHKKQAGKKT